MPSIGIVGAGIAGLHLGIMLESRGVDATIYTDRSADQLAHGRLLNAVMHHHVTLDRERRLGVDHWDPEELGWQHRYQNVHGPTDASYAAAAPGPCLAIDYRTYLPALISIPTTTALSPFTAMSTIDIVMVRHGRTKSTNATMTPATTEMSTG